MKLTAILLLTACLTASANGFSQITLSEKNAPLQKVLKEIQKQSGYDFFYTYELIEQAGRVTIQVKNVTLEKAVQECLEGKGLSFEIVNRTVVIKKKAEIVSGPVLLNRDITGRITDKEGNPLSGASVKVKGTTIGTTTNENGEFTLTNIPDDAVLDISFVGFEAITIAIKDKSRLAISLEIITSPLQETIIRGYYTEKKITQVGNVTKVKGEDIQKQPIGDPVLALQGRVAGLQVSVSSGLPGAALNVNIRGLNSIANSNNPLFIVDGVQFPSRTLTNSRLLGPEGLSISPFSSISMEDIESIEVLKDADATAIYGSRGANGVILITTKKGKAGKTKFTANLSSGAGQIARKLDLLNTQQYLQIRHEALSNDGVTTIPVNNYDIDGSWDTTKYTDWQKTLIGGTSHLTNANLSFSGGNASTQFMIGGQYRKETTVFPGNSADKKYSVYTSIVNNSENRKLNTQFTASYLVDNNQLPTEDLTRYIFFAPNAPAIYDDNANLNWQNNTFLNPFAYLLRRSSSITKNLISNLKIAYTLIPGLQIKSELGYNQVDMQQDQIFPLSSYRPSSQTNLSLRKHTYGQNNISTWNFEPQLAYNKQFAKVKLDLLVGGTFQETVNKYRANSATNFPSDAFLDNVAAATTHTILNTNYAQYRYTALFSRISFNYQQRYLVNLTGRRDGSTRFGPKKQFGNFGAVGVGWIFSNEEFIKNKISFLSYGKLRGSYGSTGNDQLPDYSYLSTYSTYSFPYLGLTTLYPTALANPYYGWEKVKKLEFGIELGFLKDRVLLNASYYRNRTDNQLVGYSLPTITGSDRVQANLPAVIQNTGLELELTTFNIRRMDFSWSSAINITFPQNKLVAFPNLQATSYSSLYDIGKSLSLQKLYHSFGIDPQSGVYKYDDLNGDGIMTLTEDRIGLKENRQNYYGGINNSFNYKGVTFDFFFQFVKQTGFIYLWNGFPGIVNNNQPVSVLDRWLKPGDKTTVQRLTQDYGSSAGLALSDFSSSDATLGDASFIRLKNVSLSYSLPIQWIGRLGLTEGKVYVQGQNLFTITHYKGLDPETQSMTKLPPLRMIIGGVQISF